MCIITLVRKDADLPSDDVLQNCFDNNDDAAGFSYVSEDILGVRRIKTHKYKAFAPFLHKLKRCYAIEGEYSPFMLHFRIETSGVNSTFNCHPFDIDDELCFCHNGIIHNSKKDSEMNDTQVFNRDVLKQLPKDFLRMPVMHTLLQEYIGAGSKLVFLDIDGWYDIINEDKGEWHMNCWYSNTSYKRKKYVYKKPQTAVATRIIPRTWRHTSVECDFCSTKIIANTGRAFDVFGACELYCKACATRSLECGAAKISEEITVDDWLVYTNSPPATSFHYGSKGTGDDVPANWM